MVTLVYFERLFNVYFSSKASLLVLMNVDLSHLNSDFEACMNRSLLVFSAVRFHQPCDVESDLYFSSSHLDHR